MLGSGMLMKTTNTLALWLPLLLLACGGARRPPADVLDDEAALPEVGGPSLQLYAVLTKDPKAMQGKSAVAAMWAAVEGQGPRYQAVRRHVKWVPGKYEMDVSLDFANLPHEQVDLPSIKRMAARLGAVARAKVEGAKLAVFVRSSAKVLPQGNHIRLAGLAALFAADQHDGIIIDLVARRAWTPSAWQRELAEPVLSTQQLRLETRADGGGKWLLSRGNPKYGHPDLQMRGVPAARLTAARKRFIAAQEALLRSGGKAGATLKLPGGGAIKLLPCDAPKGFHDANCVQIPAP